MKVKFEIFGIWQYAVRDKNLGLI